MGRPDGVSPTSPRGSSPVSVLAADRDGLTAAEAAARFAADGANELPRRGPRPVWRIVLEVLREPMLALLLTGGIAYLILGDLSEALTLLAFATFSIVVTVVQETRTEHVLEALRDLSSPRALVIRDGVRVRIAGREVVCGDLMVVEQGDRVAADAVLVDAVDMQVDESLLSGESLPVTKRSAHTGETFDAHRPGGGDQPVIYAGSLIARGRGLAIVTAAGADSAIGRIGVSLATLESEAPRLRRETARIVRYCGIGGAAVALAVVLLYGFLRGGWVEALLAGIAIGMAMLPEEFPVVLTIFLAMGAWRIGRIGVLTRRASAIETLGSATILCTDKTGTLTENRMSVVELWLAGGETAHVLDSGFGDAGFRSLIENARLASAPVPTDPMDIAIQATGPADALPDRVLRHAFGLRPDLLAVANVWEIGGALIVAAKGAPETIAALCHLPADEIERFTRAVEAMAARGIRVLGVATAIAPDAEWPESHADYVYHFAGLVGLADPLRETVAPAVAECRDAGIRVVMITGDYAATARSIAAQAGIADGTVLTGSELNRLDAAALARQLPDITVFARIMPEQKLRIVQAFKAGGDIVAMTGDGVNDAPSLKAAHIGIAMGKRGTDVAREASAIVLLDDDFGSIVRSVRMGRRIYDNIRKAMGFIFAVHVPIAGLALLPLFLGMPILFSPIHIALLEMVIDPVCALVFEAEEEEADIMRRPPRAPDETLFSWGMIGWSVLQGGVAFAMLAGLFLLTSWSGMPEVEVRALVFFALVASIMALILVNRSFRASLGGAVLRRNAALRYVVIAVLIVTALILTLPAGQHLLGFGSIAWRDMLIALGMGAALLFMLEAAKPLAVRLGSR